MKLNICGKLLPAFDSNVAANVIVSLHILSHIHVWFGYKIKYNYGASAGLKLISQKQFYVLFRVFLFPGLCQVLVTFVE